MYFHWLKRLTKTFFKCICVCKNMKLTFITQGLCKVTGCDPFNQNFRNFRSKPQWIGSVQLEKFRKKKNWSTF